MTKPVDILIVIDSLRMGGAEKSLVTLLGLMPRESFNIDLMLIARVGELLPLVPDRVNIIPFRESYPGRLGRVATMAAKAHRKFYELRGWIKNNVDQFWKSTSWSIPAMRQRYYDVAIAYHQGFPTSYVATKVKARRKLAWVNTDMTSAAFDHKFNSRFYEKMDTIVTVSDTLRSLFISAYPSVADRVTVINDPIDPAVIKRMATESHPYSDTPSEKIKIATVGRLDNAKGIDIAIKTAALLRDKGVDFRWDFIGDGARRGSLSKLITDLNLDNHVKLHGTLVNPYPWMAGCDLYVQPSRYEGYGIAIVEALNLDRTVIVTDFPVAHDRITPGVNGAIAPGTPEGLASAIMQYATPEARAEIDPRHNLRQTDITATLKLLQ